MCAVSDVIRGERQRMVDEGEAGCFVSINSGLCGDFADQVVALLAQATPPIEADALEIINFFQVDPETGFAYDSGGPMDREVVRNILPAMLPPDGMTWDELDAYLSDSDISMGMHVFVVCDGKVYDSELPDGGDSIFDLPLFQRYLAHERRASVTPA